MYPIIMSQGKFVHKDSLTFPFEERGAQFGDGVYEVIRIYHKRPYLLDEHIERLFRSLHAIYIEIPYTKEEMISLLKELVRKNDITEDSYIYLQVTRGSAPRVHTFPEHITPNIYAYVNDFARETDLIEYGVETITLQDERWENCYIKTLNLLPNILARQKAKEQGCYEAILHRDGVVTECGSSNIFLIKDEKIYTHPATNRILKGCVRIAVERFAKQLNIPFIEEPFTLDDIVHADEMFLTSSMSEIMPVIKVDSTPIQDGKPGPISKKLQAIYEEDAQIQSY